MQDRNPLISVIVPVYNVEEYVLKCIQSIASQRYENLEILLIDDGSTDGSAAICEQYANTDSRIKLYKKTNGGLSDARNFGIGHATGQFIAFVDSDDHIHEEMYKTMADLMISEDADIVICGHYVVDGDELISVRKGKQTFTYTREEALVKILKDEEVNSFAWDKLYKSTFFDTIRYPVGRIFEDTATTYKLFNLANKVVRIDTPFYYYVRRKSSLTGLKSMKKDYDNFLGFYERFLFSLENVAVLVEESGSKALLHGMNVIDSYALNPEKGLHSELYLDTQKKVKKILDKIHLKKTPIKSLRIKARLFAFHDKTYISLYSLFHKMVK